MAVTISGTSVTYSDNTVQSKSAVAANVSIFTSPGTFTIPSTTTRLKVTLVGGSGGQSSGYAGATGGTSSFGSYASATGGPGTGLGAAPNCDLNTSGNYGVYGSTTSLLYTYGGYGIKVIDAPFPVTSVPVPVGIGGGGGGGFGLPNQAGGGTAGSLANGGHGGGCGYLWWLVSCCSRWSW